MLAPHNDRVAFLIDGFNLYHSIKSAERDIRQDGLTPLPMKWLDIRSLCQSYLHLLGKDASLTAVYYFSALATHLEAVKPDVVLRHQTLLTALESTGVVTQMGRFKEKRIWCPLCDRENVRHEEKETDVAICVKLLELFFKDECDTVVCITGDTDVAPAVRTARHLFPHKQVIFGFPYRRKNNELAKLAPRSFSLSKEQYAKHQFPDVLALPEGRTIYKPASW